MENYRAEFAWIFRNIWWSSDGSGEFFYAYQYFRLDLKNNTQETMHLTIFLYIKLINLLNRQYDALILKYRNLYDKTIL